MIQETVRFFLLLVSRWSYAWQWSNAITFRYLNFLKNLKGRIYETINPRRPLIFEHARKFAVAGSTAVTSYKLAIKSHSIDELEWSSRHHC